MTIYIKYMVGVRCTMLVKKILDDQALAYNKIELGIVELKKTITDQQRKTLKDSLKLWGLDIIEDNKDILVEKIKNSIVNMIDNDTALSSFKTSYYLSTYLNYNYNYLANVFSQQTGTCLSDFIIARKIEKVKEMLLYEDFTISEIAWKMNYSSVAHLSNQFTKVTGLRPTHFKKNFLHKSTAAEGIESIREVA